MTTKKVMTPKPRGTLTAVQKRTANSAVEKAPLPEDEAKYLEDLRGWVWQEAGRIGGSWKSIAAEAKLADQTVRRFAIGETRRPMLFTIRRLVGVFGYDLR